MNLVDKIRDALNRNKEHVTSGDENKKARVAKEMLEAVGGKRGMRRARRQLIVESFTRLLAHKPMASHDIGQGREWRAALKVFTERWAERREMTYRRKDRAAIKALARRRWEERRDERRARRRAAREAVA